MCSERLTHSPLLIFLCYVKDDDQAEGLFAYSIPETWCLFVSYLQVYSLNHLIKNILLQYKATCKIYLIPSSIILFKNIKVSMLKNGRQFSHAKNNDPQHLLKMQVTEALDRSPAKQGLASIFLLKCEMNILLQKWIAIFKINVSNHIARNTPLSVLP